MAHDYSGQLIVVKDVDGNLLVRRVCAVAPNGVFVKSEAEWEKQQSGLKSLGPVGFPAADTYLYPSEQQGISIENGVLTNLREDSLTQFFPGIHD